jgi:hypothetical protein
VSSASLLEVTLSESAREYLIALDPRRQRNLALSLLTFRKTTTPPESRALAPGGTAVEDERLWIAGEFEIVYRVRGHKVEIGIIRPAVRS